MNHYYLVLLMLLLAYTYSPVNRSASPRGFSQLVQISHTHTQIEYNTKHAHYINVKHTKIIGKVVPSVSPAVAKKWQIKLGDAGQYSPSEMFCPHEKYSAKIGD